MVENTFSSIGYTYLDNIIEELSNKHKIKILFPISDFTVNGSLFKVHTSNKNIAIRIYSKYKEEILLLEKDILRIERQIEGINNKFCNETWLSKCPNDIILKEYNKLCMLETELGLKHTQVINKIYIKPKIELI